MPDRQTLTAEEFARTARDRTIEPGGAAGVVVLRAFPAATVKAADPGRRVLEFTISDASVDRMRDTVSPAGWELENFRKNPVVLWAHDAGSPPGARAIETWVQGGALKSRAQFMPEELYGFSHLVYRLYGEGYMRAVSVGFVPKAWRPAAGDADRPGGLDFTRQELTEYSCVPVPANPSALIEARAKGIDTRPMKTWAERALDELGAGDARRTRYLEDVRRAANPSGRPLLVALRDAAAPAAARKGLTLRGPGVLTLRDGAPTPAAETRTLSRAALAAAIRQVVDEEVARAIRRHQGRVD